MTEFSAPVGVNQEQCHGLGRVLAKYSFREDFYHRPFLSVNLDAEAKSRLYFFSVGICHQTWNLANPAANLYGWDYLEEGFLQVFNKSSWLADPFAVSKVSLFDIANELATYFVPPLSSVSSLDRLEERSRLYFDMAEKLINNFDGSVLQLLHQAEGKAGGSTGIYKLLEVFEAYSDPLRKKSSFFLKLLSDAHLFFVKDTENLIPVMDYHMQRVLLRTGSVEVYDSELRKALLFRQELFDDFSIREACLKASSLIAAHAGKGVLQMNDVLYMLGRSCCLDHPLCASGRCAKQPCSLTRTLFLDHHPKCIFTEVCKGAHSSKYRRLWNPVVKTHYY